MGEQCVKSYQSSSFFWSKSGLKKYQQDASAMADDGWRVVATSLEPARHFYSATLIVTYQREKPLVVEKKAEQKRREPILSKTKRLFS